MANREPDSDQLHYLFTFLNANYSSKIVTRNAKEKEDNSER